MMREADFLFLREDKWADGQFYDELTVGYDPVTREIWVEDIEHQ